MTEFIQTRDGDTVQKIRLGNLESGDLIKRKPDAKAVYIVNFRARGYSGQPARYSLSDYHDLNREIFLNAETPVYVGFTF